MRSPLPIFKDSNKKHQVLQHEKMFYKSPPPPSTGNAPVHSAGSLEVLSVERTRRILYHHPRGAVGIVKYRLT